MKCGKADRCKNFNGETCEYSLIPRPSFLCFEANERRKLVNRKKSVTKDVDSFGTKDKEGENNA